MLVGTQDSAIQTLQSSRVSIIVLNVVLDEGSAFAVADYASYRFPDMRIVFVTSSSFFSDGSIFALAGNACAYFRANSPAGDLAAVVDHYSQLD